VPELPEVESARATIARAALDRPIADVDDTDTWECRPHAPGEIRAALLGHRLTVAGRQGKTLWCETDGGPVLGLHLGMSGHILVTGADGTLTRGGDYLRGDPVAQSAATPVWNRFTITFADGGDLRLFDKRRLGRVRLDPDLSALGPDAERITAEEFRARVGRGTAPVKARMLDQSVLAGVGNLLVDETLWQAGVDPRRRVDTLDAAALTDLHAALQVATKAAIANGGVHTGEVIAHRRPGGHCPRCGAEMARAEVGGRTTWYCPAEQR
jgi:formamidopyrimidine-DNA glycosylase